MKNTTFFKPTNLYKEYMILDLIEKNSHITQREMASHVGISVSMINIFLDAFELNGMLKRHKQSSKTVDYLITKKGIERRKYLNLEYLKHSKNLFFNSIQNIVSFFEYIFELGFRKIILYGAGSVSDYFISALSYTQLKEMKIVGIIDDDESKHHTYIQNIEVLSLSDAIDLNHDGLMISSLNYLKEIHDKLKDINYDKKKIINYFN